jgi:AhpD family alkylhydroperoxidase
MTQRLNYLTKKNDGVAALMAVEAWIAKSFDPKLMTLVKFRVSQMNGCAYCLHLHRHDAQAGRDRGPSSSSGCLA